MESSTLCQSKHSLTMSSLSIHRDISPKVWFTGSAGDGLRGFRLYLLVSNKCSDCELVDMCTGMDYLPSYEPSPSRLLHELNDNFENSGSRGRSCGACG